MVGTLASLVIPLCAPDATEIVAQRSSLRIKVHPTGPRLDQSIEACFLFGMMATHKKDLRDDLDGDDALRIVWRFVTVDSAPLDRAFRSSTGGLAFVLHREHNCLVECRR